MPRCEGVPVAVDCVADVSVDLPTVVTNELLCFVQQKSKQLAFDDTVAICVDFYMLDKCKKLQFIHTVNGDGSKTAKIIKRQC